MVTDPAFSIVVPTFRRPEALFETLRALLNLDYAPTRYEVIVVDDASELDAEAFLASIDTRGVKLTIERQQRRGAAAARNRGAAVAGGELFLFCDDDVLVESTHLRQHLKVRERHGDVIVNGLWEFAPAVRKALASSPFGRYRLRLEQRFQEETLGAPLGDGCYRMELLGSWDLCLTSEAFRTVGAFDEDFPVAGAEDQDFSLRCRGAGFELLLDSNIRCLHNDDRLTLKSYCAREERSAQTMPVLAIKYPDRFSGIPYVQENRPIRGGDPPSLVVKKLAKTALSRSVVLGCLHRVTALAERTGLPETMLDHLYAILLGLHLFRGFRRTWRET